MFKSFLGNVQGVWMLALAGLGGESGAWMLALRLDLDGAWILVPKSDVGRESGA
jgi:hypothetical protein